MDIKHIFNTLTILPVLPLMYFQGKQIKAKVPQLPEAKNPSGTCGNQYHNSKPLNILIIGESTMAGVGVETHQDGFAGAIALELSSLFAAKVQWKVHAKSGYTTHKITQEILPCISKQELDVIVIGIGGNDAFNFNSPTAFKKDIEILIEHLKNKFPNTPCMFCSVPPIKEFPAFTKLIKKVIGDLVDVLGQKIFELSKKHEQVYYQNQTIRIDSWNKKHGLSHTALAYFSDGVHPSKLAYQTWAKEVAQVIYDQDIITKSIPKQPANS